MGEIEGKKILVTGGAGFIGSNLVKRLASKNDVTVLDNLSSGSLKNLGDIRNLITFIEGDICDKSLVADVVDGIDIVFHMAASTSVEESVLFPASCMAVNVGGTVNLLEASRDAGVKKFVYSSSAAVYGETKNGKINEGYSPRPISTYGISKLLGEQECMSCYKNHCLPVVILRYFNVYGLGSKNGKSADVISIFTQNIREGKPLNVYGDGWQTRDFVYVDDVVDANIMAVLCPSAVGQVFNIASGESVSINYLVYEIEKIMRNGYKVSYEKERMAEIRYSSADIDKAMRLLDYRPTVRLQNGLRMLLEDDVSCELR